MGKTICVTGQGGQRRDLRVAQWSAWSAATGPGRGVSERKEACLMLLSESVNSEHQEFYNFQLEVEEQIRLYLFMCVFSYKDKHLEKHTDLKKAHLEVSYTVLYRTSNGRNIFYYVKVAVKTWSHFALAE